MAQLSTRLQNELLHKGMSPLDTKSLIFQGILGGKQTKHINNGCGGVYSSPKYDYSIKIILLGDQGVGKTSFMKALKVHPDVDKVKCDCRAAMSCDHLEIEVTTSWGKTALVRLYDTGGQERYRSLTSSYYRGAQGALLIFDLKHQMSMDNVDTWLTDLDSFSTASSCLRILLGSNCTATDRQITKQDAQKYAENRELPYMEFDATQYFNVIESLQMIVDRIARELTTPPSSVCVIKPSKSQELCKNTEKHKGGCRC